MHQKTAIVLDPNQKKRDEIRICLSHCGVLPICFDDEWICLENILYIRPTFAVVRTASAEMVIHFIHIARAIENRLPIIILSDQPDLQRIAGKPWLDNLFFLPYPAVDDELKKLIVSIETSDLISQPPGLG